MAPVSTRRTYTRKPLTPYQQLLAAIARVEQGRKEGKDYRVAGQGNRTDTGETFYCVPSDSEKLRGLWHVITVKGNGTLDCDCFFSREKHQVCSHRATVYLHLKDHPVAPEKPQPPAPQRIPAPTPHEQASRREPVGAMARKVEQALPADHVPDKEFSIYR
jgi:hypothetical protein